MLIRESKRLFSEFLLALQEEKYKRFLYNILLSFLCVFAFFLPDYILKMNGSSNVQNEWVFNLAFFIFGFVLSMMKNKKVFLIFIITFFVFESIQLHYMAYFGKPITPLEIKKIFTETNDVAQSGFSYFFVVWYVLPSMLFSYGIYIYFFLKYSDKCFKSRISYIILIIVLLVKPERAYRKSLKHFLPGPTRNSIHNTLNTFSYFFVKEIWNSNRQVEFDFKDYKIEKIDNFEKPDIIIFLVVESMNYKNLGLYGYHRDTTPKLNKLKDGDNFLYRKALSSSVSTAAALPFLFNVIREPGNLKLLNNKKTNLIGLASDIGYRTYFFTSQESKILNDLGVEFLDRIITKENDVVSFADKKDDVLLEYVNKALFNSDDKGKFISIFQRNLHSPYEINYEEHEDEFDIYNTKERDRKKKLVNAYDNAVLYEDYFIYTLISYINNIKDKSAILVVTADHGQMLGEDNLYGHNILDARVSEVPFMVYYNNKYKKYFKDEDIPENVSHYEISKFVAGIMGYSIENPNEDGILFIQGNDIYYENFIIPYIRKGNNVEFRKIDSTYNYFSNLKK